MNEKIWLSSPHMGGTELSYVNDAFETNWIAPLGPHVDGFEQDIRRYLNHDIHVAALSSGTAALHLALIILGVKAGDEVLCQSMTFSASANPIVYQGANPIFIDSEAGTWNICPETLEEAIIERIQHGRKPKAMIIVHLYGMPAQLDRIMEISRKYQIPVIEDAAEALGSTYKGQAAGTFGDIGILSFNGNKIITTSGGGALLSKNEDWAKQARFLATQARDAAPHYQHSKIGFNYRMSNVCAGIGRGQMEVLPLRVEQRRANYAFYQEAFREIDEIEFNAEPGADFFSNRWLSTILLSEPALAEKVRLSLEKENIECRPLWKPMHLQPVFEGCSYFGDKTAERLFGQGLCLPSGSNLTRADLNRVVKAVVSNFTHSNIYA